MSKIKKMDFVKSVSFDVDYTRPIEMKKMNFGFRSGIQSARVIGIDDTFRKMYDGSGEAVAVIDANFTPEHQVFKLDNNSNLQVTRDDVKKLVNKNKAYFENFTEKELYLSEKIPFAFHYINKNTNLNPEKKDEGHGQHVAGIIGGNYALVNGKYEWKGVAPNSQLLLMNCFANEATSSTYYIKVISDAVYLRAPSINMSLGRPKKKISLNR